MFWKWLLLSALFLKAFQPFVFADDDNDAEKCDCILLGVTADVNPAKGYDDAPVKVDMKMKKVEGGGDDPDFMELTGYVDCQQEISNGYQVKINVNLETPNGEELVWSGSSDICNSMTDSDAPWFPLLSIFNTTECPIVKAKYPVPGMQLNLDFSKGFLTPDMVGDYKISMVIDNAADKVMGFDVGCEIYQEEMDCKYCPDQKKDD